MKNQYSNLVKVVITVALISALPAKAAEKYSYTGDQNENERTAVTKIQAADQTISNYDSQKVTVDDAKKAYREEKKKKPGFWHKVFHPFQKVSKASSDRAAARIAKNNETDFKKNPKSIPALQAKNVDIDKQIGEKQAARDRLEEQARALNSVKMSSPEGTNSLASQNRDYRSSNRTLASQIQSSKDEEAALARQKKANEKAIAAMETSNQNDQARVEKRAQQTSDTTALAAEIARKKAAFDQAQKDFAAMKPKLTAAQKIEQMSLQLQKLETERDKRTSDLALLAPNGQPLLDDQHRQLVVDAQKDYQKRIDDLSANIVKEAAAFEVPNAGAASQVAQASVSNDFEKRALATSATLIVVTLPDGRTASIPTSVLGSSSSAKIP